MGYDGFIEATAERVDALPPQRRAAVFWLAGTALREALTEQEAATWGDWMDRASGLAVDFVLEGRVGPTFSTVWEEAMAATGPDASQVLNSVIICLSTPLAIALDPENAVGPWVEHSLFPLVHVVSLDHFDDVAFPDDEELDEVFSDDRVQAAVDYYDAMLTRLETDPQLDHGELRTLLRSASVLVGDDERGIEAD